MGLYVRHYRNLWEFKSRCPGTAEPDAVRCTSSRTVELWEVGGGFCDSSFHNRAWMLTAEFFEDPWFFSAFPKENRFRQHISYHKSCILLRTHIDQADLEDMGWRVSCGVYYSDGKPPKRPNCQIRSFDWIPGLIESCTQGVGAKPQNPFRRGSGGGSPSGGWDRAPNTAAPPLWLRHCLGSRTTEPIELAFSLNAALTRFV